MAAMQIFSVGCAVPSFNVGYEMLGASGFSKYGTFTLIVKFSWNAGNGGNLQIIYNNIYYPSFPNMCFAGPRTLPEIMQKGKPLVIKSKFFLMFCNHTRITMSAVRNQRFFKSSIILVN
jgi:hypothetical protein